MGAREVCEAHAGISDPIILLDRVHRIFCRDGNRVPDRRAALADIFEDGNDDAGAIIKIVPQRGL